MAAPFVLVMIAMCVALYKDLRQDPMVRRGQRGEVAIEQAVEFGTQNYGDGFYLPVKPHKDDVAGDISVSSNGHSPQTDTEARHLTEEKSRSPARPPPRLPTRAEQIRRHARRGAAAVGGTSSTAPTRRRLRLARHYKHEERVDMSVAVAHQASTTGRLILQEAAKEASLRQTSMTVIHIPEGVDIDLIEEQQVSLRDEIADVLGEVDLTDVDWTLQVATGVDVAETVLDLVADTDVELLVIGARHRARSAS